MGSDANYFCSSPVGFGDSVTFIFDTKNEKAWLGVNEFGGFIYDYNAESDDKLAHTLVAFPAKVIKLTLGENPDEYLKFHISISHRGILGLFLREEFKGIVKRPKFKPSNQIIPSPYLMELVDEDGMGDKYPFECRTRKQLLDWIN